MTCSVTEPQTGAAPNVDVTTTAYLEIGGTRQPYTLGDTFTAPLGSFTQVVVQNTLKAVTPTPPPTPTPTPPPVAPAGDGQPPSGLADTGSSAPSLWLLLCVGGLVVAGSGLVALAAGRRRVGRTPHRDGR